MYKKKQMLLIKSIVLLAVAVVSSYSVDVSAALNNNPHPGLAVSVRPPLDPQGEYAVYVFSKGQWREAGTLGYDRFLRDNTLNLSLASIGENTVKVRLVQRGGGAAHIDGVFLNDVPPVQAEGVNSKDLLKKISKKDNDLIDAFGKTFDLVFPTQPGVMKLKLTARIEGTVISKTAFQFPGENTCKEITPDSAFYTCRLNPLKDRKNCDCEKSRLKAEEAFFKEYCNTGSGHPSGFTYGWVAHDDTSMYVTIDFTPDNTMDGNKDYASVYIKTSDKVKEFRVSEAETIWGKPDLSIPIRFPTSIRCIPLQSR